MKTLIMMFSLIALTACSNDDYNSKAVYGDTGLPKNCRAIVQANIGMYKQTAYSDSSYDQKLRTVDDVMQSLERNCGSHGKNINLLFILLVLFSDFISTYLLTDW